MREKRGGEQRGPDQRGPVQRAGGELPLPASSLHLHRLNAVRTAALSPPQPCQPCHRRSNRPPEPKEAAHASPLVSFYCASGTDYPLTSAAAPARLARCPQRPARPGPAPGGPRPWGSAGRPAAPHGALLGPTPSPSAGSPRPAPRTETNAKEAPASPPEAYGFGQRSRQLQHPSAPGTDGAGPAQSGAPAGGEG